MMIAITRRSETEQTLGHITQKIDAQLDRTYFKMIRQVFASVIGELQTTPLSFSAKAVVSLIGLSSIFPAFIGTWACLKTLQVIPLSNLESSDYDTAKAAAQGIGNTGMAVTYMVQLYEFVFHPIGHLFLRSYYRQVCKEISEVYDNALRQNSQLSLEQRALLVEKKNDRLAH